MLEKTFKSLQKKHCDIGSPLKLQLSSALTLLVGW